jgi:hypothetical protein
LNEKLGDVNDFVDERKNDEDSAEVILYEVLYKLERNTKQCTMEANSLEPIANHSAKAQRTFLKK